jgi:CRP/FNR family transcriptional regulator, cyclic AMP receptor protein
VQTIGAGNVLGWSWLFAPFMWRLQAQAVERTRVICLDGAHVLVQCENDPKIGYEIMKRVSQVVIERLHSLATQNKP